MLTVEQQDRDAVQAFHRAQLVRLVNDAKYRTNMLDPKGDDTDPLVQAFAAHRIAGEQAIVAWLRGLGYTAICPGSYFADRIELGEHLKDTP